MSDNLAQFLLARIAEDEEAARRVQAAYDDEEHFWAPGVVVNAGALVHPARVLAECTAKRRIVEQLWLYVARPDPTSSDPSGTQALWIVKMLAQPYAGHEGFREEWKVQ